MLDGKQTHLLDYKQVEIKPITPFRKSTSRRKIHEAHIRGKKQTI